MILVALRVTIILAALLSHPSLSVAANPCGTETAEKADTVIIDKGGNSGIVGGARLYKYPGTGPATPAGPVVAYLFQKITPEDEAKYKADGFTFKEGEVYL